MGDPPSMPWGSRGAGTRLRRKVVDQQGAHKLGQLLWQQGLACRADAKEDPIRHRADFLREPPSPGATKSVFGIAEA